jgi:ribosomal protein uS17
MSETENETTEETPVETPAAEVETTDAVEAPAEDAAVEETPAAEETPAEETPAAPPQQAEAGSAGGEAADAQPVDPAAGNVRGPKPKRKRLPRALRPKKGRVQRVPATERKPISRQPKPEHERGRTQERRGVVVSDAMDKTIVVKVDMIKSHPKYKKVIRRSVKFHAHDEQNSAHVGDVVRIVETRPLSKTKRWRLAEVVEVAK